MHLKNRADYFFSKFLFILIKINYYNNKVNFSITTVQHITLKKMGTRNIWHIQKQ